MQSSKQPPFCFDSSLFLQLAKLRICSLRKIALTNNFANIWRAFVCVCVSVCVCGLYMAAHACVCVIIEENMMRVTQSIDIGKLWYKRSFVVRVRVYEGHLRTYVLFAPCMFR